MAEIKIDLNVEHQFATINVEGCGFFIPKKCVIGGSDAIVNLMCHMRSRNKIASDLTDQDFLDGAKMLLAHPQLGVWLERAA